MATAVSMTRAAFAAEAAGTFRGVSLCERDDGRTLLAYGRVPLHVFMGAVEDHDRTRGVDPDEEPIVAARYVWAIATGSAPCWGNDITSSTPGAFVLTVGHR